jgi:hypothetical protein
MTLFRRLLLLGLGLFIVALALCALLYVWAPIERQSERVRPAPTLFVPPP